MKIKIVNRSHHPLPSLETGSSTGTDLRAFLQEAVVLKPLERTLIPTGLFVDLHNGYEAQIRPRRGMALKEVMNVILLF